MTALSIKAAQVTEFGVGVEDGASEQFVLVPVDAKIQTALNDMVAETRLQLNAIDPTRYQPSEKYGSTEHLYLSLDDDLASHVRRIHEAVNLPANGRILADPSRVFCYFSRITDSEGQRVTGIKRAGTFKGILKSRLVQFATDALKIVEEKCFKLDNDFDILVDLSGVNILRPSGFEFVGRLQGAILDSAPKNIKIIQRELPFVDFTEIESYAVDHPRAARYLASIRAEKEARNIDRASLKDLCNKMGVKFREEKGQLIFDHSSVMDFLEVLDRRLYQVELVKGSPESFRAASRSRLN
jgi:hypothetical protein